MRQPVHRAGEQPGIAQNDLFLIVSGRIALVEGFHVCIQKLPDLGNAADELDRNLLGRVLDLRLRRLRVVLPEAKRDRGLLDQVVDHILDQNTDPAIVIVASVILLPVIARIKNVEELLDNVRHRIAVRLAENIHLVNISAVLVILQYTLRDFQDPLAHHLFVCHCWLLLSRVQTVFGPTCPYRIIISLSLIILHGKTAPKYGTACPFVLFYPSALPTRKLMNCCAVRPDAPPLRSSHWLAFWASSASVSVICGYFLASSLTMCRYS